jgi:outer membrane protein TolC
MRAFIDRGAGPTAPTLILLAFLHAPAAAAAGPLALPEAQRIAVERDAGREALAGESAAMRDMAVAAGELPDPEARVGAVNLPVDSWALDREDMTMLEVGLMQRFPAGRTRQLSRARLESDALAADAEALDRARRVRFEVERTWRELDFLDRALALLDEESRWVAALAGGAEAAYAVGEGGSLEFLDTRLMAIELEEKRLGMQRERDAMLAELARWVGEGARGERAAASADVRPLEPVEALVERLQANPMLQSLGHMQDAALREVDLAGEMYKPAFGFDVAYGFRDGRGMDGVPRSDMLTAMLTFDIPLFTKDRQDREAAAARSRARAAGSRRTDMGREFEARLRAAHARALRLAEIVSLYETQAVRLAGASMDASLSAYRASMGSLGDVVTMHHRVLELREREARARADYALALAEIEYLAGDPP